MYNTIVRARWVDCVTLGLWLTSAALFLGSLVSRDHPAAHASAAVLAGLLATSSWLSGVIRGVEDRVRDQMTIEHRSQTMDGPPPILSSVR